MNSLFQKYNLVLPNTDADSIRGDVISAYGRLKYYTITDRNFLRSLPRVCEIPPQHVFLAEITGSGFLTAHRDHGIQCCMNYYFEPNNSVTSFYKEKPGAQAMGFPGKTTANLYQLDQIDRVCSFSAQPDECYLLNVSEIHSVYAPNVGTRRFITWQWDQESFDTVSKNLIPIL
jgi:hypothetical protein